MTIQISNIDKSEYQEVVEVWEASVRTTHHFLKEEDIQFFKPLILEKYLDAVKLRSIRDEDGHIMGFSGVAEQNLEMLFIHPDHFGKEFHVSIVLEPVLLMLHAFPEVSFSFCYKHFQLVF